MALPAWTALTAVSTGKLVAKVTSDGTAWVATSTGTTGASEPVWPTIDPWTVTDGSTAWALTTSFRTKTIAGLLALLTTFRNANPNLVKGVSSERPKSITNLDLPGVYIAGADETITPVGTQLVQRTLTGLAIVAVDVVPDNVEAGGRQDVLVDGLVGALIAGFHAIDTNSILQATSVQDFPIDERGIPYLGTLISLSGTFKTEGLNRN